MSGTIDRHQQEPSLLYDARYYESGCGPTPYGRTEEWLSFFKSIAADIAHSLNPRRVLDAGCAMGLLVEALWDLGIEARGIDISPFAIGQVRPDMRPYCCVRSITEPIPDTYDLITCIEVLEHLPGEQADIAVANLCGATDTILFSSTPFDFNEPTHFNIRPVVSWLKLFGSQGFWPDILYDASFICQHAMLLRRTDAALPDSVLTLFSRMLHQRTSFVDTLKAVTHLTEEKAELSGRICRLEAERDVLKADLGRLSSLLEDLKQQHADAGERAARLEDQRELAHQDLFNTRVKIVELEQTAASLESRRAAAERKVREVEEAQAKARQWADDALRQRDQVCAELSAEGDTLRAKVAQADERLRELEEALRRRDRRCAEVSAENDTLRAKAAQAEEQLAEKEGQIVLSDRHALQQAGQIQQERAALVSMIGQLQADRLRLSSELGAVYDSPGWRTIEKYRDWRGRAAQKGWFGAYERLAAVFLRRIGGVPQGTRNGNHTGVAEQPAMEPSAAVPPGTWPAASPAESGVAAPPAAASLLCPEVAKFALIISGCPGDAYRYRAEHQAEELRFLGLTVDTALFDQVDYESVLSKYLLFVMHRVPHTPGIEQFIRRAKEMDKPVIFDTDDLIFNEALLSHIKAIRDFSQPEYDLYVDGVRRYFRTLSLCSGAMVTTEPLRDEVLRLFPEMPVHLNRNAVSQEMVRQASAALEGIPRPEDGLVRLAYFSGTRTHQDDFAECVPALVRILQQYPHTRLLAVGHLDVPDDFTGLAGQIESLPLMPWQDLPAVLRRVDINLAPLELDNRFTDCKSELKYFEAGLLGVPTVASDVSAYRVGIVPGENGFLCQTAEDWHATLERLVLDPALRARVGAAARQDILRRYITRARAPEIGAVIKEIAQAHPSISGRRLSVALLMRAPIAQTGGGYKNIFILGHYLAEHGYDLHFYVEPIAHLAGKSDPEIIAFCEKYFGKSSAVIHVGHQRILPSDIAIATNWPTAYTVAALTNTRCKAYLVQDYEPEFYEKTDPDYLRAERTYDLPLQKIALGRYLAVLFSERDGLPVPAIRFSLDRSTYRNHGRRPDAPLRILFFARPGLKRRAYPVGVEALRIVAQACPDVEIVFYGMASAEKLGYRYRNLGELTREQVAEEMNHSHIHLSFSLTNISWVPFEAMACGCAVVEANVPSVRLWTGSENQCCLLADPEPQPIADAIIALVRDPALREKVARAGEQFVSTISASWETTCAEFDAILRSCLFQAGGGLTDEHAGLERSVRGGAA